MLKVTFEMSMNEELKQSKSIIASFVINEALHRQLKIYAASNGKKIKDVLDEALKEYLNKRSLQ